MSEDSLNRWRRRLERAAALVLTRLDDPPSLQELAAAAAVSPFHFHRIWRALTGETVGQTTLRLRMEASKNLLQTTDTTVSQTAMAVGFATPQSFARAFRRHTGMTPSEHRAANLGMAVTSSEDVKIQIEQRGETLVVALRREGKAYSDLNATFSQVWAWAEAQGVLSRLDGLYGIPLDDPHSLPVDRLRYDACLALGIATAPEPFRIISLQSGPYARLRHVGPYDGLEAVTQRLVGHWLPASGWEPANFPVLHQFINDPDGTPVDRLITDVFLPLASRSET